MNDKEYEALLSSAGKKLGTSPDALRATLEKGDMAALSAGLSKNDKAKLRAILANKELMSKLRSASSPQEVMALLKGMN